MGRAVQIKPMTLEQLRELSTPGAVPGGNMECLRAPYFDTQTYPAAGVNTLTFFADTNGDRTLSNMQLAGAFPDPQFHIIRAVRCDAILPLAAISGAAPTAWADMHEIFVVGRPTLTLTVSSKPYIQNVPLVEFHGSGGIRGFGYNLADATVAAREYAENGPADGGYDVGDAIIIPPQNNFGVTVAWGNAQAVTADVLLRVTIDTYEYRRIL